MASFSNAKFDRQITKFFKKDVKEGGTKNIRKIGMQANLMLMSLSPVDQGTFRGNWNVALNAIDRNTNEEYVSSGNKGSYDPLRLAIGESILKKYKIGNTINISNSLPYAMRLEFGYSNQAPNGMVRVTKQKLARFLKDKKSL